jgi:hypothetical protein
MFLLNMSCMYAMEIVTAQTYREFNVDNLEQKNSKNNENFKIIKKKNNQLEEELYKEGLCQRIGLFLYRSSTFIIVGALAYQNLVFDMPIDNAYDQHSVRGCSDCLTIV